jgi:hypothetical protein
MQGLATNVTGDSLSYLIGPRWSRSAGRWSPYVQMLAGGNKLTTEQMYPELKAALELKAGPDGMPPSWHDYYTTQQESSGFSLEAGTGVSFKINEAIALRVASLDYTHSWAGNLGGVSQANGLQFRTGVVLRMGTW